MDQVLLPHRLVQPERCPDLILRFGRQVGVEDVEGRVVSRLRFHQEEGERDDEEQRQYHLTGSPDQIACHQIRIPNAMLSVLAPPPVCPG